MITSVDAEKAFDKIQYPLIVKLSANRKERSILSLMKGNYKEPTGNIILHIEILSISPQRLGKMQGCLLSPHIFNLD